MVVRESDLSWPASCFKKQAVRDQLLAIQTPREIISQELPPPAIKILPDKFSDFESILAAREEIRHLKVLPVKDDASRSHYHTVKKDLLGTVEEILGKDRLAIASNAFPYFLPPDVDQKIIWIREEVSDRALLNFIVNYVLKYQHDPSRLVMFERPRRASTPLVRGSFPAVRHVHFWSKIDES